MNRQTTRISPADMDRQRDFCQKLHERFAARPSAPLAFVDTYGCQQNEADSERLRGYLSEMGYAVHPERGGGRPDCHQHLRHPGARRDAGAGQRGRAGAHQAGQARPAHLRVRLHGPGAPHGAEDQGLLPAGGSGLRPPRPVAVPGAALPPGDPPGAHLRHCRRARLHRRGHPPGAPGGGEGVGDASCTAATTSAPTASCPTSVGGSAPGGRRIILDEIRGLVAEGYKDITLLGQNVNSYGKDLDEPMDFADLLRAAIGDPRGLPAPLHDQPPQGRLPEALRHHGVLPQDGPLLPPALPGGERPDSEGHEPGVRPGRATWTRCAACARPSPTW